MGRNILKNRFNFKLPDFDYMQPRKIKQECKKLEYKYRQLTKKKTELKSSEEEFRNSFNKLMINQSLNKRDVKNLASYLERIYKKSERYFFRFIDYIKENPQELMPTSLALLIQNIYKCEIKYAESIYGVVKNVLVYHYLELTERLQEKYKILSNIINGSPSSIFFKKSIIKSIKATNSIEEINKTRKKYFVEVDSKLFIDGISDFINKNYQDKSFFRNFIKKVLINRLAFQNLKYLFRIILRKIIDNDVKLPRFWLILIREKLGHPATPGNSRWNDIFSDRFTNKAVKDKFRELINSIELYDFFEKLSGNRDRLNFWKEYIPYMYRAEAIKNLDSNPFIMEFERHTFIEFGRVNNALYCYNKADMNIEIAKKTFNLKNRGLCDFRFSHIGYWQNNLQDILADRGYGKRRRPEILDW